MVSSGVAIHRALDFLAEGDDGPLGDALTLVVRDIERGISLGKAFSRHPRAFDQSFCAAVTTGESSGRLAVVLERLADRLERSTEIRQRVIASLTYPGVLLVISLGSIYGFLTFLLPTLEDFFLEMAIELPLATRLLMMTRQGSSVLSWVVAVTLIAGWFLRPEILRWWRTNQGLRLRFDTFALTVPVIGDLIFKFESCRFLLGFVTLIEAGLTVLEALRRASTSLANWPSRAASTRLVER